MTVKILDLYEEVDSVLLCQILLRRGRRTEELPGIQSVNNIFEAFYCIHLHISVIAN
jgi:hypothetical protein